MDINHYKWMKYAILEGLRSKGLTGKNPPVGCVIVKDNNFLSSGRTSPSGRPHAEENAINSLNKDSLFGSTMYVTLEPCAHKNKNGISCAEIIVNSGIKKVFISCIDMDNRTNKKGIKILKRNNITVIENFLRNDSLFLYNGFFSRLLKHKPYITLKIACSLDGKIALKNKKSKWITNALSRKFVHLIRSQHDAIMTSSSTILHDNPKLNCRLNGLENYSPVKVILDRYLKIPSNFRVYNEDRNNAIILYSLKNLDQHLPKKNNTTKIKVENLSDIDFFNFIFKDLADRGINNLLIECGSKLNTILLSLNLVDELIIFRSGKIIGNDGIPFFENSNFKEIDDLQNYKLLSLENLNGDILETRKLN